MRIFNCSAYCNGKCLEVYLLKIHDSVYAIYSFCYNFFKKTIFVNVKLIFQSRIFKLIALNTSSVQMNNASMV